MRAYLERLDAKDGPGAASAEMARRGSHRTHDSRSFSKMHGEVGSSVTCPDCLRPYRASEGKEPARIHGGKGRCGKAPKV